MCSDSNYNLNCIQKSQVKIMPKVNTVNVYDDVLCVRRSTRHGHRRTQRHARKVKQDRTVDRRNANYDRDYGGYNAWGPEVKRTKREKRQLENEKDIVRKLGQDKNMTPVGYTEDDFVVPDDTKAVTFAFDTDAILDVADEHLAESAPETEEEDWDSDCLSEDS